VETFGRFVEWVPVCPEVEMGLGTPRETLRLVRIGEEVRMVMPRTGADHTDAMRSYAERRLNELAQEDLCGYVLKKGSPSCGMERVRVFDAHGVPAKSGRGLFAEALLQRFPNLPVEEEGRLYDPRLRENFIERAFAYHRLRTLFAGRWNLGELVAFHTSHKLLLMAHSPRAALGGGWHLLDELPNASLPEMHLLFQHIEHDDGVTRCSRRPVLHGIGQFLD